MRPATLGVLGALAAASVAGAILFMPSADVSDVRVGERIFPDFAARTAEVRSIEYLGADAVLRCAVGDETLTVRTSGIYEVAAGADVHLHWPANQSHWFGADERRIDD